MKNNYKYLFPFELVPPKSNILIYGAGDVGQAYLKQIKISGYCNVLGFIDQAYEKIPDLIVPVYPLETASSLVFDYIVIAMKTGIYIKNIIKCLKEKGVDENHIIYVKSRTEFSVFIDPYCAGKESGTFIDKYAYEYNGISIALKYGPGLGDCIVKKKLFESIVKLSPKCKIDIYAPNASHFIQAIYGDHPNLNLIVDDAGALYAESANKYILSLKVFFMLEVDCFDFEKAFQLDENFANKIKILKTETDKYNLTPFPVMQNFIHFNRMKYMNRNYYQSLDVANVFQINDTRVSIPIRNEYERDYEKLGLPSKYVTVNYGNGSSTESANCVAKQWARQNFENFVKIFHELYPDIQVVQLGSKETQKIVGCDYYILGEHLEVIKYVLKNARFHLDIEGGLVHLATQLNTRCVVLFGPTPISFFGYEQNLNIVAGNCQGCCYLYEDINACACKEKESLCMKAISPALVLDKINNILNL